MVKRRRVNSRGPENERRETRKALAVGLLMMVVGLALAGGSTWYRGQLSNKADRLRAEGRPITAQVSDFYSGSGRGSGADWTEVTYWFDDREYRHRVKCGGFTGCVNSPGPTVTIRVDPHDPDEFVMPDGNATGSLFFLNALSLIPAGLVVAVAGGVAFTFVIGFGRRERSPSPVGGTASDGTSGLTQPGEKKTTSWSKRSKRRRAR